MRKLVIVVLSVSLVALAAACGGGDSGGSEDETTSPPQPTPTETSGVPAGCEDMSTDVFFSLIMKNTAFAPKCLIARSEQAIVLENQDGVLHNFTITGTQVDVDVQPHDVFNGESAGLAAGTYAFFCKYHRSVGMAGTIVVT